VGLEARCHVPFAGFTGKGLAMPANRLDVGMVSEITAVAGEDTFERPIYAGNAMARVKSTEAVRFRGAGSSVRAPRVVERHTSAGQGGDRARHCL
jgi:electron transfer flavoprotein alpha subunit